jgi:Fur family ferric uptake transcriptional regulator
MERRTKQRDVIKQVIEGDDRPLSIQEIHKAAKASVHNLGIATVYRAIKELCADGWLRSVDLPNAQVHYEQSDKEHHHHFHCRTCARIFELDGCPGHLTRLVPKGFEMEGHEIVINGLCSACSTKS